MTRPDRPPLPRTVTVLATGPQTLVEDLGRPGYAHLGVPPSGALDTPALRLANRLVGNAESAAGLEILHGGLRLRAGCSCHVAVTGPATAVTVNDRHRRTHTPLHLSLGDVLAIAAPIRALRNYLALSGGVDMPAELDSRSTDVLSGIGPAPVRDGDVLTLGTPTGVASGADQLGASLTPAELTLPVSLGPRDDWFAHAADQLSTGRWCVSADSNRVGIRLSGPPLRRVDAYAGRELASEPMLTGAIQVPPDGQPVVLLADHPTTGGYPVIGVLPTEALPPLAHVVPGTELRFRPMR